jgi:uncharacterized protein (DUF1499 family)
VARRRIIEDPVSRLAVWARRLGFFALVTAVLSVVIVRSGMLEFYPALATFGGALTLAGLAILSALGAFVVIWREGLRGFGAALAGLLIAAAIIAYPAYIAARAYRLPAIYDITTDPVDPPRLETLARLRPREGTNAVAYAGRPVAEQQLAAYPDIEPLLATATVQEAYQTALDVVTKRRWAIIDARAPQPGRRDGIIEAVARTPVMGFREDVVVRVRAAPDGARIDLRSASRYGRHDFGSNAARIRGLIEEIEEQIDVRGKKREPARAQTPTGTTPARR